MATHGLILFLVMTLRTYWSGWELCVKKWVNFP